MAHKEQINYVNKIKNKFPNYFTSKKVLGIGTFNVCGTEDIYFTNCDYSGLDLGPGPGVDIVCPAQDYDAPDNTFDVIISCECFEHNPYYKETIQNAVRMLKPGGMFLFTCATTGRPVHGIKSLEEESKKKFTNWKTMPNVSRENWDNEYYKNLTEEDIRECIDIDDSFSEYEFEIETNHCDLFFYGFKKQKNMISVIIPTLWKSEGFIDRLIQISNNELVGEIILIDNAPQETDISYIPKLNHIKEPENTFVLPAWNKGVSLAKYDKLLIVNDDVETDWSIINLVYPYITEDKGIIGAAGKCWDNPEGEFRVETYDYLTACYACLFFIHKNSYIFVPHEFKIHYGDNWLFNQIKETGKSNYAINGWVMGGESEQTSGLKEFDEIKRLDNMVYALWRSK